MPSKTNRRRFIQLAALSGASLSLANSFTFTHAASLAPQPKAPAGNAFIPRRAASWWCSLDDLLWPQKPVIDKIKRRADGFAKAQIDTAINFGFHNRFDFSNYFDRLHGYYANVCEELHQRNIRFMDHYSCNHICRPRDEGDFRYINKYERHAVLLFPDPTAAKFAQYEGHLFQDLCEVDLRDGSRGYAKQYQFEAFCHNNPGHHDMHKKYLEKLMKEVPFDGIEVDDMCSYPGNTTCGCKYCRDRFRKDYGHEIPDFSDKSFFGDTTKEMLQWGNYDNPAYRDWLRMKSDSVRDHIMMIKKTLGDKPLMTCCSNTGPIVLSAVALDLEKMAPYLDLFMLENVGTNVKNVEWVEMDAEALVQKDIAEKRGQAPAMALSYELTEKGAYLGWALARFWGVGNWSSTLNGRLEEDPPHAMEMEDVISVPNNWEKQYSDLDYMQGRDLPEVRVVFNSYCKENGWRDAEGHEHWDRVKGWSAQLVKNKVGYRFVRAAELADPVALTKEKTPLVLDGIGCVSDKQFAAIKTYLAAGNIAWIALPFGTHDEKGFPRQQPLSQELLKARNKNLHIIDSAVSSNPLEKLIAAKKFKPIIKQLKGDPRWTARIRLYDGKPVIHFMNTGLVALPDELKDLWGTPLMKDIDSDIKDNDCVYEVNTEHLRLDELTLQSPELKDTKRPVRISKAGNGHVTLHIDLDQVKIYAVAQTPV
ncbi:hypothetical protein Q4E93_23135 [Flavitalea sp. BT771]|uniref:hypothetical protein n=1 Tax=Flavitalea sp. BT771 TaxID=3063329 RepID=UPI0026E2F07A|nr:hypothetical protein [Flavitalea sp. BT771]MDO6433526.1 hypothetical protein [Flavitalea sp. BT771]MDV6222569.1 hypothetical protein [Flavitalea sp. BT771]